MLTTQHAAEKALRNNRVSACDVVILLINSDHWHGNQCEATPSVFYVFYNLCTLRAKVHSGYFTSIVHKAQILKPIIGLNNSTSKANFFLWHKVGYIK